MSTWKRYGKTARSYRSHRQDGRILGKMGHSERVGANIAKNIPGNKLQPIFENGINYFKL